MTRLLIVRHGNTFDPGDTVRRVGARTDLPLSRSGKAQANTLARHFAVQGQNFEKIFAAPLKRTQQTAEAIRRATSGPALTPAPNLKEIDYGPDEGAREEDVLARIGQEALDRWEADAIPPPGWIVDPPLLIHSWRTFFAECGKLDGPILAVTSNGVARFALDAATSKPNGAARKLKTGAYGVVNLSATGDARVVEWNRRPNSSELK